jgi:hypothetical protein
MNGEFNGICSYYYRLTQLLDERETNFRDLLDNAKPYNGETNLSELDAMIQYNRGVLKAKTDAEKTASDMRETERIILLIMQYFEIPPGTKLKGEVIEELEFEIWADENDAIYISKTKDLVAPIDEENIMRIKFSSDLSRTNVVHSNGRTR